MACVRGEDLPGGGGWAADGVNEASVLLMGALPESASSPGMAELRGVSLRPEPRCTGRMRNGPPHV